jgi:hypothetical protein
MQFVTSDYKVITDETVEAQIWDVTKEFGEDCWSEDFSSFGVAHSLLPSNGYNSGICGTTNTGSSFVTERPPSK